MIDYGKELVSALNTVLPTHYELRLHSGLDTPCYSWMELNNYPITEPIGATIGYSRITFQVKVWANDIALIQKYALEADKVLRPIGFKRISSRDLHDLNSTMIQKIMTFECLALEEY